VFCFGLRKLGARSPIADLTSKYGTRVDQGWKKGKALNWNSLRAGIIEPLTTLSLPVWSGTFLFVVLSVGLKRSVFTMVFPPIQEREGISDVLVRDSIIPAVALGGQSLSLGEKDTVCPGSLQISVNMA